MLSQKLIEFVPTNLKVSLNILRTLIERSFELSQPAYHSVVASLNIFLDQVCSESMLQVLGHFLIFNVASDVNFWHNLILWFSLRWSFSLSIQLALSFLLMLFRFLPGLFVFLFDLKLRRLVCVSEQFVPEVPLFGSFAVQKASCEKSCVLSAQWSQIYLVFQQATIRLMPMTRVARRLQLLQEGLQHLAFLIIN